MSNFSRDFRVRLSVKSYRYFLSNELPAHPKGRGPLVAEISENIMKNERLQNFNTFHPLSLEARMESVATEPLRYLKSNGAKILPLDYRGDSKIIRVPEEDLNKFSLRIGNYKDLFVVWDSVSLSRPKVHEEEKPSLSLRASFSNSLERITSWPNPNAKLASDFKELEKKMREIPSVDDKFQIYNPQAIKFRGTRASACYIRHDIDLSEHHEKRILQAIKTFPNCILTLAFDAVWSSLEHVVEHGEIKVDGKAELDPKSIDIQIGQAFTLPPGFLN